MLGNGIKIASEDYVNEKFEFCEDNYVKIKRKKCKLCKIIPTH